MYSSSGGDARSTAASNARDSSSSMPPEHLSTWERQAFGRDKFDRADRDRHAPGKKEWTSDRTSSGLSSHRSSSLLSVNGNLAGPPSKRRATGRYSVGGENGRYAVAVGRSAEPTALRVTASPVENGKVERDGSSLSGGPSPGYSGSPGTERPNKDSDGHHFRESRLSPSEGRPSVSPRLDSLSRPHGSQSTPDGVVSRDRERPKFGSVVGGDTPHRDRESRERMLSKPELYRRTGSLPKLDSSRDWSLGDGELVGRLDRYGSSSIRDHVTLDALVGRKEHSRHDWRARDRSLLSPFSSRAPTSSNNTYAKESGSLSFGPDVPGATKSPLHSSLENSSTQESSQDDSALISPRKRPRLTWGQGLAKYEKEKVEEVPAVARKFTHGTIDDPNGSLQGGAVTEAEQPASALQSVCSLPHGNIHSSPSTDEDRGADFTEASLTEVHGGSSSGLHDSTVQDCDQVSAREKWLDDRDGSLNPPNEVPDESPSSVPEQMATAVAVSPIEVVEDAGDLIPGASESSSCLTKELLMQQLEKVEVEIDVVEKELAKLEVECRKEHNPMNAGNNMPSQSCKLSPPADSPKSSSRQPDGATSPVHTVHAVTEEEKSTENALPHTEDQEEDLMVITEDLQQGADHCTSGVTERESILVIEAEADRLTLDFGPVGMVTDENPGCEIPNKEPLEIVEAEVDEGASPVKRVDYVSHILQTNLEAAKCSFDSLAHLLPRDGQIGIGNFHDGGKLYDSLQEAAVWNVNDEKREKIVMQLESKVAEEQAFSGLIERALTVKYRALREAWKHEQLGNGQRKERVKAGRHGEQDHRNGSVLPSLRTSARLRSVAYSSVPDAVGEELQVARKLWNEPHQMEYQRAYLRMPSMLLKEQDRALHRFVTSNALVEDAVAVEEERKAMNPWSGEERKIFLDKYSFFGKNFSKIATFLTHKTVADCVEFYYRNQKSEEFDKVRRRHQLKKRRDNSRSSGYLATTTSFNSRHREVHAAQVEGLTLVAEAAAAMSGQRDFSKVVRSGNKMVERARYVCFESGSSDAPSKPASERSPVNDGLPLFSLSSVASTSCALSNTSLKVHRDRTASRQGPNSIVPVGKASHGELQSGVKGARSVHARSFKGSNEELDSQWTDSERELFTSAVALFGKDFHSISLHIRSKSQGQCKAFFSKTRKRLGLDKLVERHKESLQSGVMNDTNLVVPAEDTGLLQKDEIVNLELNDAFTKPLAAQGAEVGNGGNPEEVKTGEKPINVEGSLISELSIVPEVQAVNLVLQEHNAVGRSSAVVAPRVLQTGTDVRQSDDQLPDARETCIIVSSSSTSAVKEEPCAADNGSIPVVVSKDTDSSRDAPTDVLQGCFSEANLVCAETLQFKVEPVCVKTEPVALPNNVHDTSNAIPACVPLSGTSSAMPVLSTSSLSVNTVMLPAIVKDRSVKATETKTRREPTSWTQEEKEKFVDIIKKHGKNWDRLRENLPAKSLTQIKTYFQNSKAKLGLAPEGTGSGAGRGGSSRKRKADDSDSSSNAGSAGQLVSQKVVLHADEGSLKVSPSVLGPTGGIGSNIVGAEALAYATIFGRNPSQVLEDPMNAQKVFHSIGLAQNSTASAMIPMFNATGFSTASLRPVQQSFVHPTLKAQQLVNHQQAQPSLTPLVVVQPLQQQTSAAGIHQVHQLQPQQAINRTHQDLSIPVVQHLHKQASQQSQQANSQALLQQQQQQQQQLHQQVTEAVLQQKLQPQLIQRQQQQQLHLTAQQVQHHLQQVLGHHQTQTHQQSTTQGVSQQSQGSSEQVVGHQQVTGSQPKASSLQHQQAGQFQPQYYQINSKSQALLQPQQSTQQQQLQQLQLQLQQHQLQFQRQHQQTHSQQVQVQQLQKQIPGSPQLQQQQQGFHLLFEQPQQQQHALLRGSLQPPSTNSEGSKHCESDAQNPTKFQQLACEDLQQPAVTSQPSDQAPPKSQVTSDALGRSGDVKLFGQSLLAQPGSGSQPTSFKVSSTASSQVALSSVASTSFNSAKSTSDGLSKGLGPFTGPFAQGQGWQVLWPGAPSGSSGSGTTMASILQGSTTGRLQEGESETHGAQEAVARMTERLIREARDLEDGRIGDLAALSHLAHLARLQDGRGLSNMLPSLDNPILPDSASVQCLLSSEAKKLDGESKRCDQIGVSDRGLQPSKSRGPDLSPLSAAMPLGQLAASQGLPRVLDALVALDEWRLQQANASCSRVTEEFLSQSWEALHRDSGSLVEGGKANEALAQTHLGGPDMLQHLRENVFYSQPHLMHLQPHANVGGGAWASSSMVPIGDAQHVLPPQSSSFRSHNPGSSDEQGRIESRDLDGSGSAVG